MSTDTIKKQVFLKAPIHRVWRALADSAEFGSWFGMKFYGPFTPGATMHGVIVPTTVNAEVAESQKPYEGTQFEITIDQMEREHLFSFRWHPGAVEPDTDYSKEPTTLVEFALETVADGTMLTITESGFDSIPLSRRAKAFSQNESGWNMVVRLIEEYLARS